MFNMSFNSPYTLAIAQPYIPVDAWNVIKKAEKLRYGKDSDGFSLNITAVDYKTEVVAASLDGAYAVQYENFIARHEQDIGIGYTMDSMTLDNGVKGRIYRGDFEYGTEDVKFIVAIYKEGLRTYTYEIYYTEKRIEKDPHIVPDMDNMLNSIRFKTEGK